MGVQLKNGEKISAKVVLSNIDAYATFIGLVGEDQLPSDFVHAVKEIEYQNGYIQVHMTLKEMPEFTGHVAFANENNIRWIMAYIPPRSIWHAAGSSTGKAKSRMSQWPTAVSPAFWTPAWHQRATTLALSSPNTSRSTPRRVNSKSSAE